MEKIVRFAPEKATVINPDSHNEVLVMPPEPQGAASASEDGKVAIWLALQAFQDKRRAISPAADNVAALAITETHIPNANQPDIIVRPGPAMLKLLAAAESSSEEHGTTFESDAISNAKDLYPEESPTDQSGSGTPDKSSNSEPFTQAVDEHSQSSRPRRTSGPTITIWSPTWAGSSIAVRENALRKLAPDAWDQVQRTTDGKELRSDLVERAAVLDLVAFIEERCGTSTSGPVTIRANLIDVVKAANALGVNFRTLDLKLAIQVKLRTLQGAGLVEKWVEAEPRGCWFTTDIIAKNFDAIASGYRV